MQLYIIESKIKLKRIAKLDFFFTNLLSFNQILITNKSILVFLIPIFIALGELLYFKISLSIFIFTICFILLPNFLKLLTKKYCEFLTKCITVIQFLILIGFLSAFSKNYFIQIKAGKSLSEKFNVIDLTGQIEEIDKYPKYYLINVTNFNNNNYNIKKDAILRLKIKKDYYLNQDENLMIKDQIKFDAKINPIKNTKKNKFDFVRFYYFKKIIARGEITKYKINKVNENLKWYDSINLIRQIIENKIENIFSDRIYSGIISAILIGKKNGIDYKTNNLIRKSGLSHLLAISGLHLMMIGFIFYRLIRRFLAFFPKIALNCDIKKIAAFFGSVFSFIYLLLAGSPISAKRAFIMILCFYLSIILDTKSRAKYSLSLAATLILILDSYAVLTPGFQLSFMAVLGILTSSEILHSLGFVDYLILKQEMQEELKNKKKKPNGFFKSFFHKLKFLINRTLINSASVCFNSLCVYIFTSGYVFYHFKESSLNGMIANIVAIPLMTFIIMPLTLLLLFSLIFLFDACSLFVSNLIEKSIDLLLLISKTTVDKGFNQIIKSNINSFSLIVITILLMIVALSKSGFRYLILFCMGVYFIF